MIAPSTWSRATLCSAGLIAACSAGVAASAPAAGAPARCPREAPARIAATPWAPAQRRLAPAGAIAIRLCRYADLDRGSRLTRDVVETDARLVRRLVREFDRLPPMPAGTIACPYDDGSAIRASIAYADRRRVTILVDLRGCMSVTNGNLERTAFGFGSPRQYGPQLVADLERLTRLRVGA